MLGQYRVNVRREQRYLNYCVSIVIVIRCLNLLDRGEDRSADKNTEGLTTKFQHGLV